MAAVSKVRSIVVSGGFLWGMKGIELDDTPRAITSEFRRQWTRVEPFGQADWHMLYEPTRVVIETQAGEVVAQQDDPRETFAGHAWETPWTPLQLVYFNGYAMWTTTTFRFSREPASRRLDPSSRHARIRCRETAASAFQHQEIHSRRRNRRMTSRYRSADEARLTKSTLHGSRACSSSHTPD